MTLDPKMDDAIKSDNGNGKSASPRQATIDNAPKTHLDCVE